MGMTSRLLRLASMAAWGLLGLACVPGPPSYWDAGGSPLKLPRATFTPHEGVPIEIHPDGRVLRDGRTLYLIDPVGRVTDARSVSVALLTRSGHLLGNDDHHLGRVGLRNASPPWSPIAWLRVSPKGSLFLYDTNAAVYHSGTWEGCDGERLRGCTLVSHLLTLRRLQRHQGDTLRIGVGVGLWL